jgi:hypothetical protein
MIMANISSIHICALKTSAMLHNERRKEMAHVRSDLTRFNEKWENPVFEGKSIENIRKDIEEKYYKTVHQRMQKKSVPLREGVVNIKESTTLEELRNLAERLQQDFGIKTISIHTHRDEGHEENGQWRPNLHAHLIFDWTNEQGKSLSLKAHDMARMQTIVAEVLHMERGKSSDVKHLNAIQYKNKMQEEENKLLLDAADQLRKDIEKLKISRKGKQALSEHLDSITKYFGKSDIRKQYESSQIEIEQLKTQLEELQTKVDRIRQDLERRTKERNEAQEMARKMCDERNTYAKELEKQRKRAEKAEGQTRELHRQLYPWRYNLPDVVDISHSKIDCHGGRHWLHVTIEGHDRYLTKAITEHEAALYQNDQITLAELIGKYFTDEIDWACCRRWRRMQGAALEKEFLKAENTMFYQLPHILFPQRLLLAPGGSRDGKNLNLRHKSREEIIREMIDEGYDMKLS